MIYILALNPSIDYHMNVEHIEFGITNRSSSESYTIGGKGINVSIMLEHLEMQSHLLGYVGGFTGAYLKDQLKAYSLISDDLITTPGTTRINVKLKGELETEINAGGPLIEDHEKDKLMKQLETVKGDDLVIMSGSLAQGFPKDWYLEMAQYWHERMIPYIVDIASPLVLKIAPFKPLLLKPNRDELEIIFGVKINSYDEIIQYGQKLIELGAQNVLVSLGSEGSVLITPNEVLKANVPQGKVINTVGAGDSMIAAFSYAHTQNLPIIEGYRLAVAAASATAYSDTLGSHTSINTLLPSITIEKTGERQ